MPILHTKNPSYKLTQKKKHHLLTREKSIMKSCLQMCLIETKLNNSTIKKTYLREHFFPSKEKALYF